MIGLMIKHILLTIIAWNFVHGVPDIGTWKIVYNSDVMTPCAYGTKTSESMHLEQNGLIVGIHKSIMSHAFREMLRGCSALDKNLLKTLPELSLTLRDRDFVHPNSTEREEDLSQIIEHIDALQPYSREGIVEILEDVVASNNNKPSYFGVILDDKKIGFDDRILDSLYPDHEIPAKIFFEFLARLVKIPDGDNYKENVIQLFEDVFAKPAEQAG